MRTAHAPWVLLNAPDIDPAAKAGRNQDGERRSDRYGEWTVPNIIDNQEKEKEQSNH